jgi:hypothetical protein
LDASGPEEDYELQCQIDDINDALISISTIAPDDIDGLTNAINSHREMIYQTGRQSAARRSGTSSRSSDDENVMKSLKDRVDLIAQFEANGQLTPDQAKAAYGAVWAMATPLLGMGGTAQAKQAGGGEGIMRDVMGEGSGGNQPPVPDIAGMTPEDMNKEVLALNEKESSKGLSVAESARRDALYKSMTLQQSGNARDRDIGKFVDETYSMLKTIYIPDEITKKHGKANKFSIKSISNRSDAETVLGHLTSLFDEIDRKLSERTSSRYNVDLADQAKLFKSRSELEKAKQAVARMINSNFYPAAKAKPATVQ